jgi:AraC-like DNA-binding protein
MVLSGELTVHILGGKTERVSAGQCAMLFPFQSHSYDRPEGTEYFRFNFLPSLVQSFFTLNENNVGECSVFSVNLNQYEAFLNEVRKGEVSLYKVKGFLYNLIGDYISSVKLVKKHGDTDVLTKVITYVTERKGERLTLANTAAALGYNEKYLSRAITASAGFGFSTLLATLRMDAASHLLKTTSRTVVDIAIECGFGSERNFYRQFKEITGYTPKEYRSSSPKTVVINDAVLKSQGYLKKQNKSE